MSEVKYSKQKINNFNQNEFKTIVSAGAKYILNMGLPPKIPFASASACFMIGSVTGGDGWLLFNQTFIDDIIVEEWNLFVKKINAAGFVSSRIVDEVEVTSKLKKEFINRKLIDQDSYLAILTRCPYEQTLIDIYNNPDIT